MSLLPALFGVIVALAGAALAAVAVAERRRGADAAAWLLSGAAGGAVDAPAGTSSLGARLLRPALARGGRFVAGLTPAARLDRMHRDLLRAGLATRLRAEELLAVNVLTGLGAVAVAVVWVAAAQPTGRLAVVGVAAVVLAGVVAPGAWLKRRVAERKEAIFRDLPDALDLMVIGMEAGVTFDGAIQVVTDHLDTPLGQELGRALAEMELGLSRRDALQNLKRRVDVPEVTAVVVALLQADALGMSVSRVLRAQAVEMRTRRRQWARERAGRLPVKILFPLVAFIFPPVMVVILGPAFAELRGLFG